MGTRQTYAGLDIYDAFRVVLIFAAIGPLVGTAVIAILFAGMRAWANGIAAPLFGPGGALDSLGLVIVGPLTGASYFIGGIPAATAGLIIAIRHVYFGGAGRLFALGTAAFMGAALFVFNIFMWPDTGPGGGLTLGAAGAVATLACWCIVKTRFMVME